VKSLFAWGVVFFWYYKINVYSTVKLYGTLRGVWVAVTHDEHGDTHTKVKIELYHTSGNFHH